LPFERWFALQKNNEPGGQNRPVVLVVGFDQIVPLSQSQESRKNSCVASHDKQLVTAMAGLDLSRQRLPTWTAKKCLPSLPGCGTMWIDRSVQSHVTVVALEKIPYYDPPN
jgi:hypothetical protein